MSNIETGGPAFPNVHEGCGSRWTEWDQGMALRDYFAAKAMQGLLATGEADSISSQSDMDWTDAIANNAYAMADAMLRARGKHEQ